MDELYAQAFADAERGRPQASDHPVYTALYRSLSQLAEVRAGRLVVALDDAEVCRRCGYIDLGREHAGCHCGFPGFRLAGAMVIYGPMCDDLTPVFVPTEQLHNLIASGLRVQDMEGQDLTARFSAIQ